MFSDVTKLCVLQEKSILETITQMDEVRLGIVLVVDGSQRLVGTITDGDVRRAVLANIDLQQPVSVLLARKAGSRFAQPVTARAQADSNSYLEILKRNSIMHLPLVDEQYHVVGLVSRDDFLPDQALPVHAVVMAGGRGSRLDPLTSHIPKPMLRIGDRPLLEIIVAQLRDAGIKRVKVTTHHKGEQIAEHFGDGKKFGVELSCVEEDHPLGTVGGLGLLEVPTETTLVINGDILTQVDFRAMLTYHQEHQAALTVAVRHYDFKVPYGVIECNGPVVSQVTEKPVIDFFVNAGIYLLEPVVYRFIPNGQRFDATELIQRLLQEGLSVVGFPIREYWLDIGEHVEYEQANQDVQSGKVQL